MARMLLLQQNKDNLIYATVTNEGSLIIESRYPGKGEQWSYSEKVEIEPENAQRLLKLLSFSLPTMREADDGDSFTETELSNDELDDDYQLWSNL